MEKSILTIAVLALFAIGFVSSDEDENTSNQNTETSIQTEEEKESMSESEVKESSMTPKEQEMANAGYKKGTMFGMAGASNEEFSNMLDLADLVDGMDDKVKEMFEQMAEDEYDKEYHAPTNAEEEKLKNIYIENFIKGMNETMNAMDNLEKIGGNRR